MSEAIESGAANENIIQLKMKLILTSLQGSIAFREREADVETKIFCSAIFI